MKIKNITNPKEFFEKLQLCKGDISLITTDGNQLNLKSKLCQYIFMTDIFSHAEIGEMELLFTNSDDVLLMIDYVIRRGD